MTTLLDTDWGKEWLRISENMREPDDPKFWDTLTQHFAGGGVDEPYLDKFVEFSEISSDESVLDMGCGAGSLAIPFARRGCHVIAVDFSSAMVECLNRRAAQEKLAGIETHVLSWEDNWDALGLAADSVDVAIASRSVVTADMADSLLRLHRVARRRVCLTVRADGSPRFDKAICNTLNMPMPANGNWVYCLNILIQQNIFPQIRYILSTKTDTFIDKSDAVQKTIEVLGKLSTVQLKKLELFLDQHLLPTTDEEGKLIVKLDYDRVVKWAFISWDKYDL